MGLFGKKECCAICGEKLSILSRFPVLDGAICRDCYAKCTQYISLPQNRSVEEIKRNIEENNKNKELYAIFKPKEIGDGLYADFSNKLWCVGDKTALRNKAAYIFHFSDISGYEFMEDGKTITKSGAGSAIAGGLLFGGIGLVAGGLMGRKSKDVINKMSVIINVNNEWANKVEVKIITTETKKGGAMYNLAKSAFENIVANLDMMIQNA